MTPLYVISISILIMLLFFSSCASIGPAEDNDAVEIISLINSGNAAELTKLSADTFLLDDEILHGSTLTGSFWNGLADAGFNLDNPVVIESRPPDAGDKPLFGEDTEVDTFFSRYLQPQSMLFRIDSDDSEIVLILGPSQKGKSSIIAFGGPF